mmetsp:Transcript_52528/g.122939  ORF Transcript_52528/g.122939 Transcript_52528/m.122939 type:complete len:1344 (-) Transcript_52528:41-4072(-)
MLSHSPRPGSGQRPGAFCCFLTFVLAWDTEATPVVPWLASYGLATTTLQSLSFHTRDLDNVARGRPCEPAPLCKVLIDEDSDTAVEMATNDQRGRALPRSYNFVISYLKVFIEDRVYVAKVMIFCTYTSTTSSLPRARVAGNGHTSNETGQQNTSQRLAVDDEMPLESMVLRRMLVVTSHLQNRDTQQKKLILVRPQEVNKSGTLHFEFQVNEMATAVTVEWGSDPGAENGGSGCCGHLHITEVKVFGRKAEALPAQTTQPAIEAGGEVQPVRAMIAVPEAAAVSAQLRQKKIVTPDINNDITAPRSHSRATPRYWTAREQAQARTLATTDGTEVTSTSSWTSGLHARATTQAPASLNGSMEVLQWVTSTSSSSSAGRQDKEGETTFAPAAVEEVQGGVSHASDVDLIAEATLHEDGFLARHTYTDSTGAEPRLYRSGFPKAMSLIGAAISLCAAMHFCHYHSLVIEKVEETAVVRTTSAPLEYGEVEETSGPSFFYIGSESEDMGASSHTEDLLSARQALPTRSPSDSEPEKEPGTPRHSDCARQDENDEPLAPAGAAVFGRPADTEMIANAAPFLTPVPPIVPGLPATEPLSDVNCTTTAAPQAPVRNGRLVLLYASPLCYETASGPKPIAQLPVEKEYEAVISAHKHASHKLQVESAFSGVRRAGPGALISAQTLTAASLQRVLTRSPNAHSGTAPATVLHLSAHGFGDRIVLEDGRCSAHFLGCDTLRDMLALGGSRMSSPTRLVVLNACSLRQVGLLFAEVGVPHVICCKSELLDKASHVFLEAFYSYLFEGGTVRHAFDFGKTALFNHRDSTSPDGYRSAAESLELLPVGSNHHEVLFPTVCLRSTAQGLSPQGSDNTDADATCSSRRSSAGRGGAFTNPVRQCRTVSNGEATISTDSDSLLTTTAASGSGRDVSASESTRTSISSAACKHANVDACSGSSSDSDGSAGREGDASASEEGQLVRQPRPQRRGPGPPIQVSTPSGVLPSAFSWVVPPAPEDFLGRSVDVWSVIRYLTVQERRAVVVCAAPGQEPGIGKTAVLDAVHRTFVRHIGWTCISARLRAGLGDATGRAWISTVRQAVQTAKHSLQEQLRAGAGNGAARRYGRPTSRARSQAASAGRTVSRGFHPLSAMLSDMELEELLFEMSQLSELCEVRSRDWAMPNGRILLILDECDHLIQQPHFQEKLDDLLRLCPAYRIVLSTHQRMVVTAGVGGRVKVVHQQLQGLDRRDQARLFLRRAHRPLQWSELIPPNDEGSKVKALAAASGVTSLEEVVRMTKDNEPELLNLVAAHPAISAQLGNPRGIVELANQVSDSVPVKLLSELIPVATNADAVAALH